MKKVTDLKEKEVIHCPTEREAEAICLLMHNAGLKWDSGTNYPNRNRWVTYKEETCYRPALSRFGTTVQYQKDNCTIHPASDFLPEHFYLGLPLYFVVKRDDSKEWREYIDWICKTFYRNLKGNIQAYYGFTGSGIELQDYTRDFQNNPTIFNSPKEFMNLLNKNKMNTKNRFPFMLLPKDAQRIINIASSTWRDRLALGWGTNIVLGKNTEVLEAEYQEMRRVCTPDQNQLFDEIFGKDVEDRNAFINKFEWHHLTSVSEQLFGNSGSLQITSVGAAHIKRPDLYGRSLHITDENLQVVLHKAKFGGTIIEITKK
jgi:hypothetical protein